jgi:hypothetical protein
MINYLLGRQDDDSIVEERIVTMAINQIIAGTPDSAQRPFIIVLSLNQIQVQYFSCVSLYRSGRDRLGD